MTNSEDVWADDLLNRRADAEFLQAFLVGRMKERKEQGISGSYVLNIDAQWGAGKTFFLDRFAAELERGGHVVARVNAWRDDHADEPFISVMAAIDSALAPFVKKDRGGIGGAWEAVKQGATPVLARAAVGVGKTLIKRYVGMEAEKLLAVEDDAGKSIIGDAGVAALEGASIEIERVIDESASILIDAFVTKNKAVDDFRARLGEAMDALAGQRELPLFILVDELDRCRPSYAVSLLERVKHMFDADNVVFVFATNSDQLQHSISGAYGVNFDGYRYLKRFFDKTYSLLSPSVEAFVETEFPEAAANKIHAPQLSPQLLFTRFAQAYTMDLREIRQVIGIISDVATIWKPRTKMESLLLYPIAIGFQRTGKVDVGTIREIIPDDFRVYMGVRRTGTGQLSSVDVTLNDVIQELVSRWISLEYAMARHNQGSDEPMRRYVNDTFSPEWNGVRVEENQRSVQTSIPMLVAAAGSFERTEKF